MSAFTIDETVIPSTLAEHAGALARRHRHAAHEDEHGCPDGGPRGAGRPVDGRENHLARAEPRERPAHGTDRCHRARSDGPARWVHHAHDRCGGVTPANQEDTIVVREHRGHRLGMLLKVANLIQLQAERPGRPSVITFNAEENQLMLSVNEAVGFVPIAYEGAWKKVLD